MIIILTLLLWLLPNPTTCGGCWNGEEPWTDECKKFCESKRPPGTSDEFNADCENPHDFIHWQNDYCRHACLKNKCPCQACHSRGNSMTCPALPKPPTPPPPSPEDNKEGEGGGSWIWIIIGLIVLLLIVGACVGVFFCLRQKNNRRVNFGQQQQLMGHQQSGYSQYPGMGGGGGYTTAQPQIMPGYAAGPATGPPTQPQMAQGEAAAAVPQQSKNQFDYQIQSQAPV